VQLDPIGWLVEMEEDASSFRVYQKAAFYEEYAARTRSPT